MTVKHHLSHNDKPNYTPLFNALYHDSGGFTLEKFYNDPHFAPDPEGSHFQHYLHHRRGEWVKNMYQRFGHYYFTEAEFANLEWQDLLDDWIEWVQRS